MKVCDLLTVRRSRGLSRRQVVERIPVSESSLADYEDKGKAPCELVVSLARIYDNWNMVAEHQWSNCPVYRRLGFVPLNNINREPVAVACKLLEEGREGIEAGERLVQLFVGQAPGTQMPEPIRRQVSDAVQQILDMMHAAQILLAEAGRYADLEAEYSKHNTKCYDRGYARK